MKFTLYIIIILFSITRCSQEETVGNNITVNGKTHKLSDGYIFQVGSQQTDDNGEIGYHHEIFLTSDGVVYDYGNKDFSGKGDIVVIEIFSESPIPDAAYDYEGTNFLVGTVTAVYVYLNNNYSTGTYDALWSGTSGKTTISHVGANFVFNFSLKDNSGKATSCKGTFNGAVIVP